MKDTVILEKVGVAETTATEIQNKQTPCENAKVEDLGIRVSDISDTGYPTRPVRHIR